MIQPHNANVYSRLEAWHPLERMVLRDSAPAPTARGEETRRALLHAAARVFATRGVYGVSIADVAAAADVAPATIYRHFEGKDELARAAYLEGKRAMAAAVWEGFPSALPVRHAFRELWRRMTRLFVDDTSLFVFLDLRLHGDYLEPALIDEVEVASFAPLVALLARGQREEVLVDGDPRVLARFLGGVFLGAARGALRPDGSADAAFLEAVEPLVFASVRR